MQRPKILTIEEEKALENRVRSAGCAGVTCSAKSSDPLLFEAYMEAAVHLEACAIEEHDLAQKAAYREASDHNFEKAKKVISPNDPDQRPAK